MALQSISNINELQNDHGKEVTVVHFFVDWSEECKNIDKILETLSSRKEFSNINFKKCAAENFPNISTKYNVTAVPTVLFLKEGNKVDELTGADPVLLNSKLQKFVKEKSTSAPPTVLTSDIIVACVQNETDATDLNKELFSILDKLKAKYKTYNVLSDEATKEQLVTYSKTKSFPQLYVKAEFVGDLETVKKLNSSGELCVLIEAALKNLDKSLVKRLTTLINKSNIMVFMKGEKDGPRCGFSRQLMEILKETGLPFDTFDILTDENVRQGLKVFSDWPTYPQVYVKGELVGGLDIIKSLKEDGELLSTLQG